MSGLWILIGGLSIALLIMFITNKNMTKERDWYKTRLVKLEYSRKAGFKTMLLTERGLERQYSQETSS